jgi:hypothetical protein
MMERVFSYRTKSRWTWIYLLNCAHCKSRAIRRISETPDGYRYPEGTRILCPKCKRKTRLYDSDRKAIAAWNKAQRKIGNGKGLSLDKDGG